jgi:hypothetical protein
MFLWKVLFCILRESVFRYVTAAISVVFSFPALNYNVTKVKDTTLVNKRKSLQVSEFKRCQWSLTYCKVGASESLGFASRVRRCGVHVNPWTPNDACRGRTAPLSSKRCILYIYSRNISTEYFKHGIYSLFFPLENAVCFIILTYFVPVLFTFYIQGVLKLKK